jgi:multidrug efflux pump subunit AcrA (membrane-fusion protein)
VEFFNRKRQITSPLAGKVAKVNVKVNDAVQAGQVFVEFG